MRHRKLTIEDLYRYGQDALKCYESNSLVLDSQSPLKIDLKFLADYTVADDSMVVGLFDDSEKYLYGLIIFDNIRFAGEDSCAEVHIVNDRAIWGRKVRDTYNDVLNHCIFTTLYCMIPSIAVAPIALCKRLGFKKTGYIPKALPYINSKGAERMYDLQIMTWTRES